MEEETIIAPEVEDNQTETETQSEVEQPKEETIGDLIKDEPMEEQKTRVVPEAKFIELKRELKELKKTIAEGANAKEVNTDIKTLGEKYDLDADFLSELVSTVKSQAREELEAKLKPLQEKEKAEKFNKVFDEHYAKAIEAMPEFKNIANKEVIKALTLNPNNANKTFNQVIEESYGHLVSGKRTIDRGGANNKNDNLEIDESRTNTDKEYFKSVLSNPTLKKKYNENMMERLKNYL